MKTKRKARVIFSILYICFLYIPVVSQNYSVERAIIYNSSNGLCNEFVSEIHQDSNGFLWFGTQNGLQRFDGKDFLTFQYDASDPHSLPKNWVTEIEEFSHGNLWVGMLRKLLFPINTFL